MAFGLIQAGSASLEAERVLRVDRFLRLTERIGLDRAKRTFKRHPELRSSDGPLSGEKGADLLTALSLNDAGTADLITYLTDILDSPSDAGDDDLAAYARDAVRTATGGAGSLRTRPSGEPESFLEVVSVSSNECARWTRRGAKRRARISA